jgi:hypothetical protein
MHPREADAFTIFVGKSHCEPKPCRIDRIAPSGYGLAVSGVDLSVQHWGYGGERSTEAMLAHGLLRGAHIAFLECDTPIINVITPRPGTEKYLTEFVPKWVKEGAKGKPGFTKDNILTWRQLYDLSGLGKLLIRMPKSDDERAFSESVQNLAKAAAKHALKEYTSDPSRFALAGVLVTDEDDAAPKINEI